MSDRGGGGPEGRASCPEVQSRLTPTQEGHPVPRIPLYEILNICFGFSRPSFTTCSGSTDDPRGLGDTVVRHENQSCAGACRFLTLSPHSTRMKPR